MLSTSPSPNPAWPPHSRCAPSSPPATKPAATPSPSSARDIHNGSSPPHPALTSARYTHPTPKTLSNQGLALILLSSHLPDITSGGDTNKRSAEKQRDAPAFPVSPPPMPVESKPFFRPQVIRPRLPHFELLPRVEDSRLRHWAWRRGQQDMTGPRKWVANERPVRLFHCQIIRPDASEASLPFFRQALRAERKQWCAATGPFSLLPKH